jgi:hypothetical protein
MIPEEVTFSRSEQFAVFTVTALNILQTKYCCPDCCPQCFVLASLLTSGELDDIINEAPRWVPREFTWHFLTGTTTAKVNRRWLYSRWDPQQNHCSCNFDPDDPELNLKAPESLQRPTRRPGPRTAKVKACEVHRQARKKCTCSAEPAVI